MSRLALAALVLLTAADAAAFPMHRRLARVAYGKAVPCQLCHGHGGGTERNAYGEAWAKHGESLDAFKALDELDVDGDGVKNKDEILAGSGPADAKSTPGNPGRYGRAPDTVPVPTEQLQLVMPGVERIEASEPDLTAEQVALLEKQLGRPLSFMERYPTLYFGQKGGQRSVVAGFAQAEVGSQRYTVLVALGLDGKIQRLAMFRAGRDTGTTFRPYLECFTGKSKEELPVDCAAARSLGKQKLALGAISSAITGYLWTVWALFAKV